MVNSKRSSHFPSGVTQVASTARQGTEFLYSIMRSDRNTTCAVVDILLSPHISYNDQGTGQSFFATIRNFHLNSIIKSNKVSESAAGQMEKN